MEIGSFFIRNNPYILRFQMKAINVVKEESPISIILIGLLLFLFHVFI